MGQSQEEIDQERQDDRHRERVDALERIADLTDDIGRALRTRANKDEDSVDFADLFAQRADQFGDVLKDIATSLRILAHRDILE